MSDSPAPSQPIRCYSVTLEWFDIAGAEHSADEIQVEAENRERAVCSAWRTHASGFRIDEPDPYAKVWVRDDDGVVMTYNCGPRPRDVGYRSLGIVTGPTSAMQPALGPQESGS